MARLGCVELYKYRAKTGLSTPGYVRLISHGYEYINYHPYYDLSEMGMKIGFYRHGWWRVWKGQGLQKIKYYIAGQKQVRIHLGRNEIRINRLTELGELRYIHYYERPESRGLFIYENRHKTDVYICYNTEVEISHYNCGFERVCNIDWKMPFVCSLMQRYNIMMELTKGKCH